MDTVKPGIHAFLLTGAGSTFNIAGITNFIAESAQLRFVRIPFQNFIHDRMLRRHYHKGDAHDRIRPGRINRQLFLQSRHVKAELQTFAATDPVGLHGLDPLRPAGDLVQIF